MYYRVNEDEQYHGLPHELPADFYGLKKLDERKKAIEELGILKTLHDMYNSTEDSEC